ncbi:MAG: putative phosphoribosyl transferase [Nocardioidaceae bacterium]|jgi:putative phosphoribosyl transferase|nr:putative phosphoribosyl transferase [Nocardioidaceae bacterium]
MLFWNRTEAGVRLAERVRDAHLPDPVVLGLPRGGVPVAFMVARALSAPLDVLVVRKVGVPYRRELAMGAVGEGGISVVDTEVVTHAGVSHRQLAAAQGRERALVEERAARFRGGRACLRLAGRTVVLVDDGVATGSSMLAACHVARAGNPARLVVAVPVAPESTIGRLREVADDVVCAETPYPFMAVGQWYHDFAQVSDGEVITLLHRAAVTRDDEVVLPAGSASLAARLTVPGGSKGLVLFAHGSGSSRHSPRNLYVAEILNRAGLGTCLLDLLTPDEERNRDNAFDVPLLAGRLADVTTSLAETDAISPLPIGYFGASTGAAAALAAAAREPETVRAVVSRGGRPDLAGRTLGQVRCPTLLVVGGYDVEVLELNRQAARLLTCPNELEVVPAATHLFEERGALARVAVLARDWFLRHL